MTGQLTFRRFPLVAVIVMVVSCLSFVAISPASAYATEGAEGSFSDAQLAVSGATEALAALPAAADVTSDCAQQVADARATYAALDPREKAQVDANLVANLIGCEAQLEAIAAAEGDLAAAQAVSDAIDALPAAEAITADDADAIAAVRDSYNELTFPQKAYVSNASILTQAESFLGAAGTCQPTEEDRQAAQEVFNVISALPMMFEMEEEKAPEMFGIYEEQIADAKLRYEALTDVQKSLVNNYANIPVSEQEVGLLMQSDDPEQQAADVEEGKRVREMITQAIVANDPQMLAEAHAEYETLTLPQKPWVPNSFDMYEIELQNLRTSLFGNTADDQDAADAVSIAIANLPAELQLSDEQTVIDVRCAYTLLAPTAKTWVGESAYAIDSAEATLGALELDAAQAARVDLSAAMMAQDAIERIGDPDTLTVDDEPFVTAARTAYDALTDEQKLLVDPTCLDKLIAAENALGTDRDNEEIISSPRPPVILDITPRVINVDVVGAGKVQLRDGLDYLGNAVAASRYAGPGATVVFRATPNVGQTVGTDVTGKSMVTVSYSVKGRSHVLTLDDSYGFKRVAGSGAPGTVSEYAFIMPANVDKGGVSIDVTFVPNTKKYAIGKHVFGKGAKGSKVMLVGSDGKVAGKTKDKSAPTMYPTAGSKVYFKSVPAKGAKLTKFNVTYSYTGLNGKVYTKKLTTGHGITKVAPGLYCFTMPSYPIDLNAEYNK